MPTLRELRSPVQYLAVQEARTALAGARLFAGLPEAILDEVAARASTVTVPAGETLMRAGGAPPWERLLAETWKAASRLGRTALLAGPEAGAQTAGDDPLTGYGRLLDNLESAHDLVVLVSGGATDPPAWNAFCARQ